MSAEHWPNPDQDLEGLERAQLVGVGLYACEAGPDAGQSTPVDGSKNRQSGLGIMNRVVLITCDVV